MTDSVVNLLKFPYPYTSAITVCSDIDGTSFENFVSIHEFLNTGKQTSLGEGVRLPIGDSFWMYDTEGIEDSAFSYFSGAGEKESPFAGPIRDFIRAGIIDVMHSYGNFRSRDSFSRNLAFKALEELKKHNLNLCVWTNHGGMESVQNIGVNSFGQGDMSDSEYYHTDLLLDFGVQFFWDSELSLHTNVGQDTYSRYGDAYWNSTLNITTKEILTYSAKGILNYMDMVQSKLSSRRILNWPLFEIHDNELLNEYELRSGEKLFRFKRFGHGKYDWSDDLPRLINIAFLEKLMKKQGYAILYIHLGDRRQIDNGKALSDESIRAFRLLSNYYHMGKIWVSTTSSILKYNYIHKNLDWSTTLNEDTLIIDINGLKNPHQD